jgi:hypothetical protein
MISAGDIHAKLAEVLPSDQIAHWYSDLYAKVTPESQKIIAQYEFKQFVTVFRDQITNTPWYDIPFCYNPQIKEEQK